MSFPLLGNDKIRLAVEASLKSGHLPHAIIIEGEAGLGRHTLARYIVNSLICTEAVKPCGSCHACKTAAAGSHPDIITVLPEDKKKNISVSQIRELRQSAFIKPHMADCKIFIIDKAETMNEQAQNALLKILEEPPSNIFFLLITESATAMLETVLSRCVTFKLSPPPTEDALEYIMNSLKPKREEEAVLTALNQAKGNIGRAITILRRKNANAAEVAASEFCEILFSGSEIEMLTLLAKFEKDRVLADSFFVSLKYEIAELIRKNYKMPEKAKFLTALYREMDSFIDSLKTNINLSLLFASLVATIKKLSRKYI